jgi:hypothetical protein
VWLGPFIWIQDLQHFHLPPHHLPHHHQPSPFHQHQGSRIMHLPDGNNPLGNSLVSPGTPGSIVHQKYIQKVRPYRKGKTKLGHLFALTIASFRFSCCVELHLHRSFGLPLCLTALLSSSGDPGQVCFDSNSFPIRVDNHASYCMANSLHLFETLVFSNIIQVQDCRQQQWGAHHPHPQLSLLT